MKVKVKIKTAHLVPDDYGQFIKITKVGLYDENDRFIKWTRLNDNLIELLLKNVIETEFPENQ
jgi:hypothetical protein